jgi:hypothetical protein
MQTINVQLVHLTLNVSAASLPIEELPVDPIKELGAPGAESCGEIFAIKLPCFAVRFVKHVLLIHSECSWGAGIRKLVQLSLRCISQVEPPGRNFQNAGTLANV